MKIAVVSCLMFYTYFKGQRAQRMKSRSCECNVEWISCNKEVSQETKTVYIDQYCFITIIIIITIIINMNKT